MRILQRMVLLFTTALALAGLVTAGSVAVAPKAEAVTKTRCYTVYSEWFMVPGYRLPAALILGTNCWYDYNWWEEVVQGREDGWYQAF